MRYSHVLGALLLGLSSLAAAETTPPVAPLPDDLVESAALSTSTPIQVDLETALQWTLSSNPDLVALRQNLSVSSAAVAVARKFPISLNPTVSVDVRPWTFEREPGGGARALDTLVSVSWMQPVELGHRRFHRLAIARAEYTKTQWDILQAELLALVQTYRLHQTATYRRDKLRVARQLAEFNVHLLEVVRRQVQAAQLSAADLVLAEVENQSMVQRLQTAQQEYLDALTELRKQIGLPPYAGSAVPAGQLKLPDGVPPADEEILTQIALATHPEINAARAQVAASHAAWCLARAERIPVPSVGPVYESDESGTTFYGLALSTPLPVLNSGRTLVYQQAMQHGRDLVVLEQLRIRTIARVKASLVKWDRTRALVGQVDASTEAIQGQAEKMERLYAAGQTDLLKLLQVRQRLIEAENARLDMAWQATQAYADVLAAASAAPLLASVPPGPQGPESPTNQ
jgi:cobalt-zinc-cadmium efflux system outer membrane protein